MQSRFALLTAAIAVAFGPHIAQAANLSTCKGGCSLGEVCVGNAFSQPVTDSDCSKCATQYWWPCNFETLCFCNDVKNNAPRIPPAPASGEKVNEDLDPCTDILTEEIFNSIVQPENDEGKALFTYVGFCAAVGLYNTNHDEKFGSMGAEEQMRAEIAAFLAHVAADTRGFSVIREAHHCVDPITGSDGKVYCKPCKEEHYNTETKVCSEPYLASEEIYKEYCDKTRQEEQGCGCRNVTMATIPDASGYILASDAYFTRGAIALSWNYDYYGASFSITGNSTALCENPDLVATNSQYAWGSGIYKWMEKMQHGTTGSTAHKQVLKGNFGGTIEVLYGELECPASQWSSLTHVDMVKDRIAQVCKAGAALGKSPLTFDKCSFSHIFNWCRFQHGLPLQ